MLYAFVWLFCSVRFHHGLFIRLLMPSVDPDSGRVFQMEMKKNDMNMKLKWIVFRSHRLSFQTLMSKKFYLKDNNFSESWKLWTKSISLSYFTDTFYSLDFLDFLMM